MIYLDNCATTKPSKNVIQAMKKALEDDFANPSSLHSFGHETEKKMEEERKKVATYLGAKSEEIFFTSGGTESNNTALSFLIDSSLRRGKKVITSNIEHPSVLAYLRSRKDIDLVVLPVNSTGRIDLDRLVREIDEETILVSFFHVNNELGTIHPIKEFIEAIKSKNSNVKVHIDGVQAVGKIPVDLHALLCDTYSFSGHKFHGPKGIGGLYIHQKTKRTPYIYGGGQENGLRSGTENIPAIFGLGAAFIDLSNFSQDHYSQVSEMKKWLVNFFLSEIDGLKINSQEPSSPFILNISVPDTRGEVILHMLEQREIFISTSSACSSHRKGSNPVLEAIGLSSNLMEGTVRICLSHMTSFEEVEEFAHAFAEVIKEIRQIIRRK